MPQKLTTKAVADNSYVCGILKHWALMYCNQSAYIFKNFKGLLKAKSAEAMAYLASEVPTQLL